VSGRPLKITICGYPFKVEWIAEPKNDLVESKAVGCLEVTEQTMTVGSQKQGPHQERDTVLHETLHAILRMTGHKEDFKSHESEETTIYAMSTALLGVLRGNPHLVDWLTEELP
jgi:hypothetical protein